MISCKVVSGQEHLDTFIKYIIMYYMSKFFIIFNSVFFILEIPVNLG